MNLFEGEQTLTSADGNAILLTTHRIRSNNIHGWGQQSTTSIMLEKISSIQANYISYPILLVVAALFVLIGFILGNSYQPNNGATVVPIIIGILLIIVYFATRKHICIIASDGGARIVFATSNMKKETLLGFIDDVEKAKAKRVLH